MEKEKSVLADVTLRIMSICHSNSEWTTCYIPFGGDDNLKQIAKWLQSIVQSSSVKHFSFMKIQNRKENNFPTLT